MFGKRGIVILILAIVLFSFAGAAQDFGMSSVLLKVGLKKGETTSKTISVMSDSGGEFGLDIVGLRGVRLSENSFGLEQSENKEVEIYFDSSLVEPGVYVGSIKMVQGAEAEYLPVIFEVESQDLFFDVNIDIPPRYSEILQGERIVAQMKIFDLVSGGTSEGLGSSAVDVEYHVYNMNGEVLVSETESLVVNRQEQKEKSIAFPGNVEPGQYVFTTTVKYKSSVGTASYLFSIIAAPEKSGFGDLIDFDFLFIAGIIFVFFLLIVFLFVYLIKDRDKFIFEMRRHHAREMQMQRELLGEQARVLCKKGVKKKIVEKRVSEKLIELKKKQKKEEVRFKELRKTGNVNEMKNRLREWNRKGYDASLLRYKLDGLTATEMKKVMEKWRKEGYKKPK